MLLIPFDRKLDWKKPPLITIMLVIVNVVVYFTWQSSENSQTEELYDYYHESGLGEIEYPAFKKFLRANNQLKDFSGYPEHDWILLITHYEFNRQLEKGTVIHAKHKQYDQWQTKRKQFNEKKSKIASFEYGYKTGDPSILTAITHMFLHGGMGHLLGNMFFLFTVGFLVEATLGKFAYLGLYLLTGIGSVLCYQLFAEPTLIPGVGASGAISGVMGMYTVFYWLRPIRFFYFIYVYFDTIRLPAIILLPLWLGTELYNLYSYPESNINYLAHIGGYVAGAALALVAKVLLPSYDMSFYDQKDEAEDIEDALYEAELLCEQHEYRKAMPMLKKLSRKHPNHPVINYRLHQCARLQPDSDDFHNYSHAMFVLQQADEKTHQYVKQTYLHYMQHAKPGPRLNQTLMLALANRFVRHGDLKEAEFLVAILIKKTKASKSTLDIVERLSNLLDKNGDIKKARLYRDKAAQMATP